MTIAKASPLLVALLIANGAQAAMLYSDRATFTDAVGVSITDDYSAPGYRNGDLSNGSNSSEHSDANISAVLGETEYQSTSWEFNIVYLQGGDNPIYCTGCNGSALLTFTDTSLGTSEGVFGVGFDYLENSYPNKLNVFVTFSSGAVSNYLINEASGFWGITSMDSIRSIHLGAALGLATSSVYWKLDNLTIAAPRAAAPEPETFALLLAGLGLIGFMASGRIRKA